MALIAAGHSNKAIARELNRPLTAIELTTRRVFRKLGVDNRVKAATYYVRAELMEDGIGIRVT